MHLNVSLIWLEHLSCLYLKRSVSCQSPSLHLLLSSLVSSHTPSWLKTMDTAIHCYLDLTSVADAVDALPPFAQLVYQSVYALGYDAASAFELVAGDLPFIGECVDVFTPDALAVMVIQGA